MKVVNFSYPGLILDCGLQVLFKEKENVRRECQLRKRSLGALKNETVAELSCNGQVRNRKKFLVLFAKLLVSKRFVFLYNQNFYRIFQSNLGS